MLKIFWYEPFTAIPKVVIPSSPPDVTFPDSTFNPAYCSAFPAESFPIKRISPQISSLAGLEEALSKTKSGPEAPALVFLTLTLVVESELSTSRWSAVSATVPPITTVSLPASTKSACVRLFDSTLKSASLESSLNTTFPVLNIRGVGELPAICVVTWAVSAVVSKPIIICLLVFVAPLSVSCRLLLSVLSPITSKVENAEEPPIPTLPPNVAPALKVAAPAADISRVRAVIPEPPSSPLKMMSLSSTIDLMTKSLEEFSNLPILVPPSMKITWPPSASNSILLATSIVKVPEDRSISVPSIVMLSTTTPALAVRTPVTPNVPPIVASSVTVKSSSTLRSTTFKLAKASTTAAPLPAPSR